MTANALQLVPPGAGRRYAGRAVVRLSDAMPGGAARLDAIARYLQDVAADDGTDSGINLETAWVLRKTVLELRRRPRLDDVVDLSTWASASGARWAARRTTLAVAGEPVGEAAALWVCLDLATLRPIRLPPLFWSVYGDAVDSRAVSPRLSHPDPPAELLADARPWPLRVSDLDVMDHVNNTVGWAVVEDELDRLAPGAVVGRAEVEYREPIARSHATCVVSRLAGSAVQVWLLAQATVLVSAAVVLT